MNNKLYGILGGVVAAVIILCGLFIPVRMDVKFVPDKIYEHTSVTEEDLNVTTSSLFGRRSRVSNFSVMQSEDESVVYVKSGRFSASCEVPLVHASKITAEYTETLYQYESAQEEDFSVYMNYEDGSRKRIRKFSIDGNLKEVYQNTDISISTAYGNTTYILKPVMVDHIKAEARGTVYPGEPFSNDLISLKMVYADKKEKEISSFSVEGAPDVIKKAVTIKIFSKYGDTKCTLKPVKVKSVTASYDEVLYEGDKPSNEKITTKLHFEDGTVRDVKEFESNIPNTIHNPVTVTVKTPFGNAEFNLFPVRISSVKADHEDDYYEGDRFRPWNISICYEDGTVKQVNTRSSEFEGDVSKTLVAGTNTFPFTYGGNSYTIVVHAKKDTRVRDAFRTYQSEYQAADYKYKSDDLFVTITRQSIGENQYYLSHIVINDPSQIHSFLSYDSYGGERETPSSNSKRNHWIIGVNGSNFDYGSGTPEYGNAKIKNSQVMYNSGSSANGREICLKEDGTLCPAREGQLTEELLAEGVTDTFCCGDTELIVDGEAANVGVQSNQYRYPRTAVGMVRPCEYYLISFLGKPQGTYDGGLTYDDVRDILMSKNCYFGKCMDGGGSAMLVFKGKLINYPAEGKERAVVDFLGFTDLDTNIMATAEEEEQS